jgi:TetR/AcrR family transcriptional regulator
MNKNKLTHDSTRIQKKNVNIILEAALEAFSKNGFGGTTLDQISTQAGLSKPNILYYFTSKEAIHLYLLQGLLEKWLEPLRELDPYGDPITEITSYVERKLEMSKMYPRESKLFAIEILQGAKHLTSYIQLDLKLLVDTKVELINDWIEQEKIAEVNARHLIFSIWATTQHYSDFESQIQLILGPDEKNGVRDAGDHLKKMFTKLLTP